MQAMPEEARRAWLGSLSSEQLEAISFGEEKPAVAGQTEEAYAKNRRVELRVK